MELATRDKDMIDHDGTCSFCGHSLSHDLPVIIGDWNIDPSGVTTFKGKRIPLTAQENEVLFVIAKSRGRAVNIPSIEIRIGFEGYGNVIHTQISRVRKKMEAVAGFNTIETVPYRGYRWAV